MENNGFLMLEKRKQAHLLDIMGLFPFYYFL